MDTGDLQLREIESLPKHVHADNPVDCAAAKIFNGLIDGPGPFFAVDYL